MQMHRTQNTNLYKTIPIMCEAKEIDLGGFVLLFTSGMEGKPPNFCNKHSYKRTLNENFFQSFSSV